MNREELKGKQTPGKAFATSEEYGVGLGRIVECRGIITAHCVKWDKEEEHANAALYAEAHNVANRTGMWPEDFVERVKALEKALKRCLSRMDALNNGGFGPLTRKKDIDAMLYAEEVLNNKPNT